MKNKEQKELLVISLFREDGRKNLTSISKRTGIPISTLYEKLKTYKKGPIKRFTSLLDFRELGYDFCVHLLLKLDKTNKDEAMKNIISDEHVNSAFRINNGYDLMLECVFRNINEFELFSEKLDEFGVKRKEEHYILDEIKREAFLSNPEILRLNNLKEAKIHTTY